MITTAPNPSGDGPLTAATDTFQNLVGQVPELLQPVIVAAAGVVPFLEGEVAAVIGVYGGLNPIVAGLAGATGNFLSVLLVVILGSRARGAIVSHAGTTTFEKPLSNGRKRFQRWFKKYGVPGASLLGPLAVPTQFTSATLVSVGVPVRRILFWQGMAIILWTSVATASVTLALAVLA